MSEAKLSVTDSCVLLALAAFEGEVSNAMLQERFGFDIKKPSRDTLESLGYLSSRKIGRSLFHELTDHGWRRVREELAAAAPPPRADKGTRILYGYLNLIDRHMGLWNHTNEDMFTAKQPPAAALAGPGLEERIRQAYDVLAPEPAAPLLLRRIREHLSDVPAADLDAALIRLQREPGVHLQPEAKQRILTDADLAAAVVLGGEPRHVLVIEAV